MTIKLNVATNQQLNNHAEECTCNDCLPFDMEEVELANPSDIVEETFNCECHINANDYIVICDDCKTKFPF